MKMKGKWLALGLTAVCCAAFAGYLIASRQLGDHAAPVISFPEGELEVSVGAGEDELLAGVTAKDGHDGDVTAGIVLEGVTGLSSDRRATATYAAFDQAGNVARVRRTVVYTDYHSPTFTLSGPLVYTSGRGVDVFRDIGATDVVDGDLSEQIKATLVDGSSTITEAGMHQVEFRVTNSVGDTARLTLPVEVCESGQFNAEALLTEYLVYVKQGAKFESWPYLKGLKSGAGEVNLANGAWEGAGIEITSDVDTSVPGVYSVGYTVAYGAYTGHTRLIVVVEQ